MYQSVIQRPITLHLLSSPRLIVTTSHFCGLLFMETCIVALCCSLCLFCPPMTTLSLHSFTLAPNYGQDHLGNGLVLAALAPELR